MDDVIVPSVVIRNGKFDWVSFSLLAISLLTVILGLAAYSSAVYFGGPASLVVIPVIGFILLLVTSIVLAARKDNTYLISKPVVPNLAIPHSSITNKVSQTR